MKADVVVVGSGLAGAAAGIRLARAGWSVALFERRDLPGHKLCGEFLSPEVQRAFAELDVLDQVRSAGAVPIRRAVLTASGGSRFTHGLPGTALGLSRYRLDLLLLEAAGREGVDIHRGTAVESIEGGLSDGFRVRTASSEVRARAVIGAWGRSDRLDRRLGRPDTGPRAPWVAFKAHHAGPGLGDVIELHLFPGGYCGMSDVEEERINVCWIVHRDRLREAGGRPEGLVDGTLSANPFLADRLGSLRRVMDPYLSASQLLFRPRATFAGDVCLTGDAAGMIAPLCGDGMAMALDGAELAAEAVDRYLRDGRADRYRDAYHRAWTERFGRRMRIGRQLHGLFVRPRAAGAGLRLASALPRLGDRLIRATRGT